MNANTTACTRCAADLADYAAMPHQLDHGTFGTCPDCGADCLSGTVGANDGSGYEPHWFVLLPSECVP